AFCLERRRHQTHACDVPTRSVNAVNESNTDRVPVDDKDDWNFVRRRLCRKSRLFGAYCDNSDQLAFDQICHQRWETIVVVMCPSVLNCYIFTLIEPGLIQSLTQCPPHVTVLIS